MVPRVAIRGHPRAFSELLVSSTAHRRDGLSTQLSAVSHLRGVIFEAKAGIPFGRVAGLARLRRDRAIAAARPLGVLRSWPVTTFAAHMLAALRASAARISSLEPKAHRVAGHALGVMGPTPSHEGLEPGRMA